MIKLQIPDNNCKERTYLIEGFFRGSLSLAFKLNTTSINNYQVMLPNKKKEMS